MVNATTLPSLFVGLRPAPQGYRHCTRHYWPHRSLVVRPPSPGLRYGALSHRSALRRCVTRQRARGAGATVAQAKFQTCARRLARPALWMSLTGLRMPGARKAQPGPVFIATWPSATSIRIIDAAQGRARSRRRRSRAAGGRHDPRRVRPPWPLLASAGAYRMVEGTMPPTRCSSFRERAIFTGRPAFLARWAAIAV